MELEPSLEEMKAGFQSPCYKGALLDVRRSSDDSSLGIYPAHGSDRQLTVETLHISCKSDTYRGRKHKYGGIVIYARNGETVWYTANNSHCKSGYVVIMQTDTKAFEDLQAKWRNEPGKVHGIIYRRAFGESCKGMKVVGEGFGIMKGEFKIISGVFNAADDDYHDNSSFMNQYTAQYVEAVVDIWKRAGPNFPARQNYGVNELVN